MGTEIYPARRARPALSAVLSIAFLAAGVCVYVYFIRTAAGQLLDASSFGAVVWLRALVGNQADAIRSALLVLAGAIFLVFLVIALIRRRVRDSAIALALCVGSLVVSGGLKQFFVMRPNLGNYGYPYNTFPSGHETITVAALASAYLLLPTRLRRPSMIIPLVIVGTASGLFQVVAYAHRPSDVFAAALLVGAVAVWVPGPSNGIGPAWRWSLWVFIAIAAVGGVLCFWTWETGHFATRWQITGTAGIVLATAACVTAALTVGAERGTGERPIRNAAGSPHTL